MSKESNLDLIKQMLAESDSLQKETDTSSQKNPEPAKSQTDEEEIIDLGSNFDFDGFQVVRREFFAHIGEPSVTFNNCKFYVNNACLLKFPEADTIQVLVNKDTKILAIMPCSENARDSFVWCTLSKGKRRPKQITCKLFFAKIFSMMEWNPDYRYKILGKLIRANGEMLLAFDLTATEIYQRMGEGTAKKSASRVPVFPAEWKNQFGLPYSEHKQSLQVDILKGYAVYSIKDTPPNNSSTDTSNTDSVVDMVLEKLETTKQSIPNLQEEALT